MSKDLLPVKKEIILVSLPIYPWSKLACVYNGLSCSLSASESALQETQQEKEQKHCTSWQWWVSQKVCVTIQTMYMYLVAYTLNTSIKIDVMGF